MSCNQSASSQRETEPKLRELRKFVMDHEAFFQAKRLSANYGDGHANATWAAHRIVREEIDRLLAEPAPSPCVHELRWVPRTGGYSELFQRCAKCGLYEMSPRPEPLPELVARMYGLVGPDGRGRA